jgi:hypothetical protein
MSEADGLMIIALTFSFLPSFRLGFTKALLSLSIQVSIIVIVVYLCLLLLFFYDGLFLLNEQHNGWLAGWLNHAVIQLIN